ncbi:unnamed protein product [Penicillium olsonii]|nr:unnamed protein product [Penicillium olsonii]
MAPTRSTRPVSPERPAALGAKVKTVKGLGPAKGAGVVKAVKAAGGDGGRKLRSGKVTAPPAGPPPGPPAPPPPAPAAGQINWVQGPSQSTIPPALQSRAIASCHVDFLDERNGAKINNTAIRFIFANTQGIASRHVPGNTVGVIIRFMRTPDDDDLPPYPGVLHCRPISYNNEHRDAAHTIAVPAVTGRLGDFLRVVKVRRMLPAEFIPLDNDTVGCRDFTSQWIEHCINARLVAPAPPAFWNHFNFIYLHQGPGGAAAPAPIASAVGHANYTNPARYVRRPIAAINYATAAAMTEGLAVMQAEAERRATEAKAAKAAKATGDGGA